MVLGICDATAGPSLHMGSSPFVQTVSNSTALPQVHQFVAILRGPEWYAMNVFDVEAVSKQVQVEFMYTQYRKNFYFKVENDQS